MASLDDILTATKNAVTAINNAAQTYLNVQGVQSKANITAATLVSPGTGRLCVVSVIVAGSAAGRVYDTNSASSTSNPIYVIPNTVGVTVVNMPVNFGLVVAPGTGQTVSISYS